MTNGGSIKIKDVYGLLEDFRKENKSDNQRLGDRLDSLQKDFRVLESGRITQLEKELANLKGKLVVWGALAVFIVSAVEGVIFWALNNWVM